ncbi:MAG: DM13 domain-containing protein [Waterburya sp.]
MKRFNLLTAIAFSVALASTSGVEAIETVNKTQTAISGNNSVLVAQAETNSQFVTAEKGHPTTGTLKVIQKNGQQYIELGDDFQTVEGPAVEIILHKNETVPVNINEEDYVTIAPIQSFEGTQLYEVPEGVDLSTYASVAVWCQEFNVTFGYAQL